MTITVRKVGGLTHWRIGRVGGSWYVRRAERRTDRAARLSVAIVGLAGIAAACVQAPVGPTYAAIVVTQSGNEYRIEHGASLSDCRKVITDMPASDAYCEREER